MNVPPFAHHAMGLHSYLVKAWNYSSLPNYKSRLWNQEAEINHKKESRIP